ncbi:unnamed protein product [Amoebophrya sp. A120]|nr:unnamed protein product [Amoebophrya sp. A120]|eukprot:GSA120T00013247001.1
MAAFRKSKAPSRGFMPGSSSSFLRRLSTSILLLFFSFSSSLLSTTSTTVHAFFLTKTIDTAVDDALQLFEYCAKWDDREYVKLLIFDRMQKQRKVMRSCLFHLLERVKRTARIVYAAYHHPILKPKLDPYFVDLAEDFWLQVVELSKTPRMHKEWYYWHGPKVQMPLNLKLLKAHFDTTFHDNILVKPHSADLHLHHEMDMAEKMIVRSAEMLAQIEEMETNRTAFADKAKAKVLHLTEEERKLVSTMEWTNVSHLTENTTDGEIPTTEPLPHLEDLLGTHHYGKRRTLRIARRITDDFIHLEDKSEEEILKHWGITKEEAMENRKRYEEEKVKLKEWEETELPQQEVEEQRRYWYEKHLEEEEAFGNSFNDTENKWMPFAPDFRMAYYLKDHEASAMTMYHGGKHYKDEDGMRQVKHVIFSPSLMDDRPLLGIYASLAPYKTLVLENSYVQWKEAKFDLLAFEATIRDTWERYEANLIIFPKKLLDRIANQLEREVVKIKEHDGHEEKDPIKKYFRILQKHVTRIDLPWVEFGIQFAHMDTDMIGRSITGTDINTHNFCPSEKVLAKYAKKFRGFLTYAMVRHDMAKPCTVDAGKYGMTLFAVPGSAHPDLKYETHETANGKPKNRKHHGRPPFPEDPFLSPDKYGAGLQESLIAEVQGIPVVLREEVIWQQEHLRPRITENDTSIHWEPLNSTKILEEADPDLLRSAGLLLRGDYVNNLPWKTKKLAQIEQQAEETEEGGSPTGAYNMFTPEFSFPKDLVAEEYDAEEKLEAAAASGSSGETAAGAAAATRVEKLQSSTSTAAVNVTNLAFKLPGINPKHLKLLPEYKKQFVDNYDLVIAEDFFDEETFAKIEQESHRLWQASEMEPNCNLDGRDRLGGYVLDDLDYKNTFYQLIYRNPSLQYWVSYIYGKRMWASDFPLELREYGDGSNGMRCHRDLALYADDSIDAEFAFTVASNSPSHVVSFTDRAGVEHKINPKPNTLLMVRPNASLHCASGVDPGTSRQMMKWIFTGSYKKHENFEMYAKNNCGETSLSWKALMAKKESTKQEL